MKRIHWMILGLCGLFLLSGCSPIELKITTKPSSAAKASTTSSTKQAQSSSSSEMRNTASSERMTMRSEDTKRLLTEGQKVQITSAFLSWAGSRAEMGNMAVSDWYFDHGAAGKGDWYANTPDGQVQVQDNNTPGRQAFAIHAIGGCIFYTAKDGGIGKQELFADSFASNYSVKLDDSKPVSKYLLGDNGVVYELKTGNGAPVSTNSGFGEYNDDGTQGSYTPDQSFQVSEDSAAQEKLQQLITMYE